MVGGGFSTVRLYKKTLDMLRAVPMEESDMISIA
jgi:hypothetical protein